MQSFHAVERTNAHLAMGSDAQIPAPARGLSTDVTAQLGGSDSSRTAWRADIEAAATVPARASDVFAFLADLANHCLVADRLIEVVMLEGPPGARTGGIVRLRGPIGVRRTARLRVLTAEAPRYINGAAEIGERTVATVRWLLDRRGADTSVSLSAWVERAGLLDSVLLAVGARRWLSRRFEDTLNRLVATLRPKNAGGTGDGAAGPPFALAQERLNPGSHAFFDPKNRTSRSREEVVVSKSARIEGHLDDEDPPAANSFTNRPTHGGNSCPPSTDTRQTEGDFETGVERGGWR